MLNFERFWNNNLIESSDGLEYDKEMEDWFVERTNKHISRVLKFSKLIEQYDGVRFKDLSKQCRNHDRSKFDSDVEKIPYILITWNYHCKDIGKKYDVPEDIKERLLEATKHHVKTNKHHPEYWSDQSDDILNKNDRDKPNGKIVDATKMPIAYIAEMVSDWLSMSEEKGTSITEWCENNINIRWKFTDEQVETIYELVENIGK